MPERDQPLLLVSQTSMQRYGTVPPKTRGDFAHVADMEEIASNDFNPNISRYLDTTGPVEEPLAHCGAAARPTPGANPHRRTRPLRNSCEERLRVLILEPHVGQLGYDVHDPRRMPSVPQFLNRLSGTAHPLFVRLIM